MFPRMQTSLDIDELRADRPDVDVRLHDTEAENADLMSRVGGVTYTCVGTWICHRLPGWRTEPTTGQCSRGHGCGSDDGWQGHVRFDSCHTVLAPCPVFTAL